MVKNFILALIIWGAKAPQPDAPDAHAYFVNTCITKLHTLVYVYDPVSDLILMGPVVCFNVYYLYFSSLN